MGIGITDLLSFCARVDFGTVTLSQEEETFREELNREMLALCECLPNSMQTEAVLFLMKYLQAPFSGGPNFVNYFYAPAWSILFWLQQYCPDNIKLEPRYVKAVKTGHTMAMLLHAFDDHLVDGQLPITHLALLIRSQSWMIMNRAFDRLARDVDRGPAIVRGFIDDYYRSINISEGTKSLDSYCDLFRKQMATALIAPVLIANKINPVEELSLSIQAAYCSFGIAWRLLDDLQDLEKDMMKGVHSSIYFCLNEKLRGYWDKNPEVKNNQNNGYIQTILRYICDTGAIDCIKKRICSELDSAAAIVDACTMPGLAGEFRSLLKPLREGRYLS